MMALSSLRAGGPSKTFYQRKRDENKIHTQALLALARAWSMSCGPCCAITGSTARSRHRRSPLSRLDIITEIPFTGVVERLA